MRFEHINLTVRDIANSLRFYQAAFPHWKIRGRGQQELQGQRRQWLHFGDDHSYIAFYGGGKGKNRDPQSTQLGVAHFAFETANLDELIQRLSAAGFHPSSLGAAENHRRNAYFIDDDGFEVEFVEYCSDLPARRNSYASATKSVKEAALLQNHSTEHSAK
ncbi:MAG: VOC family protein [Wenzhouxiangella sp.]